jgi:hypothetical protein
MRLIFLPMLSVLHLTDPVVNRPRNSADGRMTLLALVLGAME